MIAEQPITTTTEATRWWTRYPARMADWTPELRSQAAREGWRRRRDPECQAYDRLEHLLRHTDARVLRLLACDLAEAVLPRYTDLHPDDLRPVVALQVARRYAEGTADDRERLAAAHLLCAVVAGFGEHPNTHHPDPDYAAIGAVFFALTKPVGEALRNTFYWAAHASDSGAEYGLFADSHRTRLLATIEARLAEGQGR